MNRKRNEIIYLDTEERFINESLAEEKLGISRYYIHKSLTKKIPVKGFMFAYYHYGMDIELTKEIYVKNQSEKLIRSKKWKNLITVVTEVRP